MGLESQEGSKAQALDLSELVRLDPGHTVPELAGTAAPGTLASCPQYRAKCPRGLVGRAGVGGGGPTLLCLELVTPSSGPWHWLFPLPGMLFPPKSTQMSPSYGDPS